MKIKLLLSTALIFIGSAIFAQDEVTDPNFTEYQDKVPGTLVFEFGYNMLQEGTPNNMDIEFLKSRSANIYYMYDFRLFGSKKLSFNPGFGLGTDNYMFSNEVNVTPGANNTLSVESASEFESGVNTDSSSFGIEKSKLNANYFDIPMEFRFRTKPSKKSFRFAVGGKIGFLIDAKTKIKYELDGDNYKFKSKSRKGLENFRYGLHARIGFGSLNFFGYYALSELFESDLNDSNGQKLEGNLSNVILGITVVTF